MLLPTLVFFIVNNYMPMVGIYFAFTKYDFKGGLFGSPFVGLDNFKFLWKSNKLVELTLNTVFYNLIFILVGNILQIFTAILVSQLTQKWFKRVTQTLMFMPYFIMEVSGIRYGGIFDYLKGQFELFYQMVGNNGLLFKTTDIIDTYVYRITLTSFDFSMGMAAGLYQSVFGFILIFDRLDEEFEKKRSEKQDLFYEQIKSLIREKYTDPEFSIEQMASILGKSIPYISRIYVQNSGNTIKDTITDLRMELAKQLLEQKNFSIYEISVKVGFSSTSYFHKAFKKATGVTPKEYQENANSMS